MPATSLGYLECPFVSVTALVADAMAKAGAVRLLGFEPTGVETIVIRLGAASPDDLRAALDAGSRRARELGVGEVATALQAKPDGALHHLNDNPNTINPIYGGREEMRPGDRPATPRTTMSHQAIGILETQGLTAALAATDAMLKAANVTLLGKEKIGAAYVAIMIQGDVAAVTAAVEAGAAATGNLGKLIAAHTLPRPHDELVLLLPKMG